MVGKAGSSAPAQALAVLQGACGPVTRWVCTNHACCLLSPPLPQRAGLPLSMPLTKKSSPFSFYQSEVHLRSVKVAHRGTRYHQSTRLNSALTQHFPYLLHQGMSCKEIFCRLAASTSRETGRDAAITSELCPLGSADTAAHWDRF